MMTVSEMTALEVAARVAPPPGGFAPVDSLAYAANADALRKAFDMHDKRFPGFDSPEEAQEAWRERYRTLVGIAESVLGPEAHVGDVDPVCFESFSDCYKDENGFRPRHHVTRAEAKAFLAPFVVPAKIRNCEDCKATGRACDFDGNRCGVLS